MGNKRNWYLECVIYKIIYAQTDISNRTCTKNTNAAISSVTNVGWPFDFDNNAAIKCAQPRTPQIFFTNGINYIVLLSQIKYSLFSSFSHVRIT